jgi:hypothetical protein
MTPSFAGTSRTAIFGFCQISIGSSALTYIPTTTAAVYSLPRDYNPTTGAALGVLVEEQRTNRALYSEDFTNAAWVKSSVTVTGNTHAAPDGNSTADTLAATGANGTVLQTITTAAGDQTAAFFLKRKTGTGNVDVTTDGVTFTTITINSSTWTRGTATKTLGAGSVTVGLRIVTSGDEVYAWGAQFE